MFTKALSLASAMVIASLIPGSPVARAQHGHEEQGQKHHKGMIEVGNKGEVSFDVETKVGDLSLKPGLYRFQHRVESGNHYVQFTEMGKRGAKGVAGEVKCALEATSEEFSRTAIFSNSEGGTDRVTRIEVRGENVVHVF